MYAYSFAGRKFKTAKGLFNFCLRGGAESAEFTDDDKFRIVYRPGTPLAKFTVTHNIDRSDANVVKIG